VSVDRSRSIDDAPADLSSDPRRADDQPWRTAAEAASRARCGLKTIYKAARSGELQSAVVSGRGRGRGQYLFLNKWVDDWILSKATVMENHPSLHGVADRRT
jgi:hypothetical protein